jgi:dihydroorotate dehydrogenase
MTKKASQPLYDLQQTFEENATYGPFWSGPLPALKKIKPPAKFLGKALTTPFGVAACPLTVNARTIALMSSLGYDLLTYKSVRSVEWRGNPFPHWTPVEVEGKVGTPAASAAAIEAVVSPADATMANSFGIHSVAPEHWQPDVDLAVENLGSGQQLILSLMITPNVFDSLEKDVRRLAQLASETKAEIFELNLACPNTEGQQGLIYQDVALSVKLLAAVKKELGNKPLLAKIGPTADAAQLREFMRATRSSIHGLTTMNTVSMPVKKQDGPEFFPGRPSAGVSGAAIRELAMTQAGHAVAIREELGLKNYVVIGVGGVTEPEHISQYLKLGVDAVQTAVGAWSNPLLASQYRNSIKTK